MFSIKVLKIAPSAAQIANCILLHYSCIGTTGGQAVYPRGGPT